MRGDICTYMKQGDVQLWNPVYCFRTSGTLRYIWIRTPHVAFVYTRLCRTIDHRWSLSIALAVPFIKTFKYLLIFFFFSKLFGRRPPPLPPLCRRPCITFHTEKVTSLQQINRLGTLLYPTA